MKYLFLSGISPLSLSLCAYSSLREEKGGGWPLLNSNHSLFLMQSKLRRDEIKRSLTRFSPNGSIFRFTAIGLVWKKVKSKCIRLIILYETVSFYLDLIRLERTRLYRCLGAISSSDGDVNRLTSSKFSRIKSATTPKLISSLSSLFAQADEITNYRQAFSSALGPTDHKFHNELISQIFIILTRFWSVSYSEAYARKLEPRARNGKQFRCTFWQLPTGEASKHASAYE